MTGAGRECTGDSQGPPWLDLTPKAPQAITTTQRLVNMIILYRILKFDLLHPAYAFMQARILTLLTRETRLACLDGLVAYPG